MSLVLIATLLTSLGAAEPSAEALLEEARARYRVQDASQTLRMTLESRSGSRRVRELEVMLRRDGPTLSSYTRVTSPPAVAGTQLLLVDHADRPDELLLWLPALRRVTPVRGRARDGAFMGSDFRYRDLELDAGEGASHRLVERTETSWVVETTCGPGAPEPRFVTRIDRADSLPRQVEWFDEQGQVTRRLTVERVELHDGVPVPMISRMEDLRRGSSTTLEITAIQLGLGPEALPDALFTAEYLERVGRGEVVEPEDPQPAPSEP
jgi:hypothetical protein